MIGAPSVHPCPRRQHFDNPQVDYYEVICDGRTHVNVAYRNGIECSRSKPHDCDRWHGSAKRYARLS